MSVQRYLIPPDTQRGIEQALRFGRASGRAEQGQMKKDVLKMLLLLAVLTFLGLGMMSWGDEVRETRQRESQLQQRLISLCIMRGGVPVTTEAGDYLRRCDFPPQ